MDVWPDKVLYAATLLLLSAVLGIVHGVGFLALDITLGEEIPWLLRAYPPEAVLAGSLVQAVCAGMALRRQRTGWALAGAIAGIASFSLFGLGAVLALIALAFVLKARSEGEDVYGEEEMLDPELWPDKALAASTVLTVQGVLTMGWGGAIASGALAFEGYMDPGTFGLLCIALGVLALLGAGLLYVQRGFWVGIAGCIGGVVALTGYLVGPLLAAGGLILLWQAWREEEFVAARPEGRAA